MRKTKKTLLILTGLLSLSALASCGEQGPQGIPGKDGQDGLNGTDGKDGQDGVDGKDGADGVDGKDGADGSKIYTGSGGPGASLGVTGDIYIDVETGDMYSKGESGWVKTGNIKGEKGDKGDAGENGTNGTDGVSITSVMKTSTDGNTDTYTITYSDGSVSSFTVTNGADGQPGAQGEKGADGHTPTITIGENGNWYVDGQDTGHKAQGPQGEKGDAGRSVTSIEKTSSDGNVDTYTIAYSDGTTSTFTITNGTDGSQGIQGEPGQDGHTPTIAIGDNGNWFIDDADTGISAKGEKGEKGDKGDTGVSVTKAYIDDNGDLICEMSDGTTINAGHVKDVTKHKVKFHVDDEVIQTISVEDGAKISTPGEDATAGYTIKSWSSKEDDGFLWRFSVYTVTSDLDLYADFDYNTYTVTYADEKYGTSIDPLTVTYDKEYTLSTIDNQTGWTFAGWKTGEGEVFANSGTYRTAKNLTLYAEWVANTYTVTLDPNKGNVAKTKITVTYDSQYELPRPTRENYVFTGWYDSNGKKVSSKATWKGTGSVTYTAKWTNIQNTYNFDAGDGTCDTYSMQIGWEDAYSLPTPYIDLGDGGRLNCPFLGWYFNDELIPQSGDSWTYSNSGGTLVAKWGEGEAETVSYGRYPQTRVSDEATIESLNALTSAESNGWYLLGGSYYAKKEADLGDSSCVFDDGTTIVSGTTYWFKCEPITWKILSSENGEYSLVSTVLLDAHRYNELYYGADENGYYANNYANSKIREWLNGDFYDSAFSLGNSLIRTTTVDNSASTTDWSSNSYACASTEDKVYLLSYKDYLNADYGFSTSAGSTTTRQCKTTDWARANGASYSTDSSHLYNGWYWTRSPISSDFPNALYVDLDGILRGDLYVSSSYLSVRPSLRIKVAQ